MPSHGYGFVYPVLIAPAWRLFGAVPDAYAAAKAINAVRDVARRDPGLLPRPAPPRRPPLALVAALLTVLVPSMLYTGTLMTENAFYPLFLVVALALVVTLERPTPLRQVVLLVLIGVAYATRAQAVALLAAAATAPLLLALVERRGLRRGLRPFATLYGILAGGALLAVRRHRRPRPLAARAARRLPRRDLERLHGRAASCTSSLYHVAELDLYLGVLPFAALLALWLAPRDVTPGRARVRRRVAARSSSGCCSRSPRSPRSRR